MGRDGNYNPHPHSRHNYSASNRLLNRGHVNSNQCDTQPQFLPYRVTNADICNHSPFEPLNTPSMLFQTPVSSSNPHGFESHHMINPFVSQNSSLHIPHLVNNTLPCFPAAFTTEEYSSGYSPLVQIPIQNQEPVQVLPPVPTPQTLPDDFLNRLQLPPDQITDKGIIPNAPYYDLPAGLMVSLILPERKSYQPLDPEELRLPLPKFPDESFLRTIDSFYKNDTEVRDTDGWDVSFIETYLRQKESMMAHTSDSGH